MKASRSQYNEIKNEYSSCVFNAKKEKENLQKKNQEMLDLLLNYVSKEIVENCKEKQNTSPATSIYDDKGIIECILVKVNDQQVGEQEKDTSSLFWTIVILVVIFTFICVYTLVKSFIHSEQPDFMQYYLLDCYNKQ